MTQDGSDLVCVRYWCEDELEQRIKTVEVVVSRAESSPAERVKNEQIEVRFRLEPR